MEARLRVYRQQKAREEAVLKLKSKVAKGLNKCKGLFERMFPNNSSNENDKVDCKKEDEVAFDIQSEASETTSSIDDVELCSSNTWSKFTLYGSLWAFLYVLAIHVEFGAVYFVISLLYIIWRNTRTSPKKQGEISAYSVFNPNCETIDGTLTAEQFEKELRYGALH